MLRRSVVPSRYLLRSFGTHAPSGTPKAPAQKGNIVLDMGTDETQATGLEKQELESLAKGEQLFGESILYGPFGTPEKPVVVKSVFDTRIVGCVGGKNNEHELTWHVVSHGKPLVCLECGQVFELQKVEDNHAHGHH